MQLVRECWYGLKKAKWAITLGIAVALLALAACSPAGNAAANGAPASAAPSTTAPANTSAYTQALNQIIGVTASKGQQITAAAVLKECPTLVKASRVTPYATSSNQQLKADGKQLADATNDLVTRVCESGAGRDPNLDNTVAQDVQTIQLALNNIQGGGRNGN